MKSKKLIVDLLIFGSLNVGSKIIKVYGINTLKEHVSNGFHPGVALLIIILLGFILEYSVIFIYDCLKMDPLLIEYFKEKILQKQEVTQHSMTTRKIVRLKKIGNKFLLIILVCFDPILTVLFFRDGHHEWNGISTKVRSLFIISVVFCTLTFTGMFYSFIYLLKIIFNLFP